MHRGHQFSRCLTCWSQPPYQPRLARANTHHVGGNEACAPSSCQLHSSCCSSYALHTKTHIMHACRMCGVLALTRWVRTSSWTTTPIGPCSTVQTAHTTACMCRRCGVLASICRASLQRHSTCLLSSPLTPTMLTNTTAWAAGVASRH
jgi:hypothetical protein